MEESGPLGYRRCATCGRWHPEAGSFAGRFCSRECAKSYGRCPVCGGYFERNDLTSDGFCSAECAGVDAKDRPEDILDLAAGGNDGGDAPERDSRVPEDGESAAGTRATGSRKDDASSGI